MKRIIFAVIALLLCVSAAACGSDNGNSLQGTYSIVIEGDGADWAEDMISSEEPSEASAESSEESSADPSFEISIEYPSLSASPSDSEAETSVETEKTDVTISITFEAETVKVVMTAEGESVSREGTYSLSGSDIFVEFDGIKYTLTYNSDDNTVTMGNLVLTK